MDRFTFDPEDSLRIIMAARENQDDPNENMPWIHDTWNARDHGTEQIVNDLIEFGGVAMPDKTKLHMVAGSDEGDDDYGYRWLVDVDFPPTGETQSWIQLSGGWGWWNVLGHFKRGPEAALDIIANAVDAGNRILDRHEQYVRYVLGELIDSARQVAADMDELGKAHPNGDDGEHGSLDYLYSRDAIGLEAIEVAQCLAAQFPAREVAA